VTAQKVDFAAIRQAIANLELSPRVEPNEPIPVDRAFLPGGHRGVLDLRRQLVVGNRGMGKSFWTHALLSPDLRGRLAEFYGHKLLKTARVEVGFNGSAKIGAIAPTTDEISSLSATGVNPDLVWRAVLLRTAFSILDKSSPLSLSQAMAALERDPSLYSKSLSQLDDALQREGQTLLIVFDALDRLGQDWGSIRVLTRSLLGLAVGLQSFGAIRAKIFMRVDQFSDHELFRFPDSSKIRNDHVNLVWRSTELYGLLLFEILRDEAGGSALRALARQIGASQALPVKGADSTTYIEEQGKLIEAIAGEFMGNNKKRGRVYTWVPLHLGDAASTCSPRSFLIAWKKAAEHDPPPVDRALDHLGLLDGVRSASTSRLGELYEDYRWIQPALEALRRQFVPIDREQLFELWAKKQVLRTIANSSGDQTSNVPVGLSGKDASNYLSTGDELSALLSAMKNVAVMEERTNGKINVPDIFRVEAEILRKGGVAVPRRF
jgi:hypothetical protein